MSNDLSVATSVTQPKAKVATQGNPPIEEKPATEPVTQQDNLASSQKQTGEARETAQMQAVPVSRILTEQEVTALRAEAKSIIGDQQFVDFLGDKVKAEDYINVNGQSVSARKVFADERRHAKAQIQINASQANVEPVATSNVKAQIPMLKPDEAKTKVLAQNLAQVDIDLLKKQRNLSKFHFIDALIPVLMIRRIGASKKTQILKAEALKPGIVELDKQILDELQSQERRGAITKALELYKQQLQKDLGEGERRKLNIELALETASQELEHDETAVAALRLISKGSPAIRSMRSSADITNELDTAIAQVKSDKPSVFLENLARAIVTQNIVDFALKREEEKSPANKKVANANHYAKAVAVLRKSNPVPFGQRIKNWVNSILGKEKAEELSKSAQSVTKVVGDQVKTQFEDAYNGIKEVEKKRAQMFKQSMNKAVTGFQASLAKAAPDLKGIVGTLADAAKKSVEPKVATAKAQ